MLLRSCTPPKWMVCSPTRSGASRQQILRKREEIRDDLRELAQDHREISESLESLSTHRDRGFGRDTNVWQRDRWGRYDNTGWGWGRRDVRSRGRVADRWGWGHGRD